MVTPRKYQKRPKLIANKKGEIKNKEEYDKIIQRLETAFAFGCNIDEACLYANISTSTFYNWIEWGVINEFQLEHFKQLTHTPVLKAKKTVVDNLDDVKVATWLLERRSPREFMPTRIVEGSIIEGLNPSLSEEDEKKRELAEKISKALYEYFKKSD